MSTVLAPSSDLLLIYDTSAGDYGQAPISQVVFSVFNDSTGNLNVTRNASTGKIDLSFDSSGLVSATRSITPGPGLAGGGDLSADRTLQMDLSTVSPGSDADPDNDLLAFFDANAGVTRALSVSALTGGLTGALPVNATPFVNNTHYGLFMADDRLGNAEVHPMSDLVIASLTQSGVFGGKFTEQATAPADLTQVWVDNSTVPSTIKINSGGTWFPATFADIWGLDGFVQKSGDTMTGALLLPDGTTAVPSLAFSADTDTGFVRTADGTIGFVANGNLMMTLGPNGVDILGTLTQLATNDLTISDNTVILNQGETGAGVTAGTSGLEVERGTSTNAVLVWSEATLSWMAGISGSEVSLLNGATHSGTGESVIASLTNGSLVTKGLTAGALVDLTSNANDIVIDVDLSEATTVTTADRTNDFIPVTSNTAGDHRRISIADLVSALAATDALPGLVELATSAETQSGTDTTRGVTPAGLASMVGSDTFAGLLELATVAETQAGTDTTRAVTPAGLAGMVASDTFAGLLELATDAETQAGTATNLAVTPSSLASLTSTTTRAGLTELATNAETQAGADTSRAITPAALASMAASTTLAGLSELATDAEALAGTDTTRSVTPSNLAAFVASNTLAGFVALATNAETQAGIDNTKAVTPSALASMVASETASGFVELASSAEAVTGTDTSRAVTPAGVAAAIAASAQPAASDTVAGIVELATNAETAAGIDATRAVTPAGLASVLFTATDAASGIVELATSAEVQSGTDTTRAVTPAGLASLSANVTRAGLVELATAAESTSGADATRAVTPSALMDTGTLNVMWENGFDTLADISVAELSALSIAAQIPIELASGGLRQIPLAGLPRSSVVDNGTTITHNDGFGNAVTFREGRSFTSQSTAPLAPEVGDHWFNTLDELMYERINDGTNDLWIEITGGGAGSTDGIVGHGAYTPATLPPAADHVGGVTYITGGLGGGQDNAMIYSDGTNWRKIQNGQIQA